MVILFCVNLQSKAGDGAGIVLQFRPRGAESQPGNHRVKMEMPPKPVPAAEKLAVPFYCPVCAVAVSDPLTCRDCLSVICRRCGTPLESSNELGMG
jgi:hypothetical protein